MFTLLSHVIIEHIFTNYIVYYFLLFHVMCIICHFIIRSCFFCDWNFCKHSWIRNGLQYIWVTCKLTFHISNMQLMHLTTKSLMHQPRSEPTWKTMYSFLIHMWMRAWLFELQKSKDDHSTFFSNSSYKRLACLILLLDELFRLRTYFSTYHFK